MNVGRNAGVVAVAVSSVLAPAAASALPAESPVKTPVTAFFQAYQSTNLITASAAAITTVSVDGVSISSDGSGVDAPDEDAQRALEVSHQHGLLAEILVNNWDNDIQDFSSDAAHKLLASSDKIAAVSADLADAVRSQGWDGVTVDLEAMGASDATGLVALLKKLREDLPSGKVISICASNDGSDAGFRAGGYDLAAIGAAVDRFMLMAYDQHGPWEKKPGPVGALWWQRDGLKVVLAKIPADRVDLGQAGYGYIWRRNGAGAVSDARARALVAKDHATARFDKKAGEWTAHLSNGSVLWWADARSFQLRLAGVRAVGLHGLAVWDLGQSDPLRL